jgi:hypothetical protein
MLIERADQQLDAGGGGVAGDLVAAGRVGSQDEVLVTGQRSGVVVDEVRCWLAWRPAV